MDFDIIDITFANDFGEKTVLPVVSSPVNIWPDFENTALGVNMPDWATILGLLLQILGIIIAIIIGFWLLTKTLHFDTSGVSRGSGKRKSSKRYRRK